MNEIQVIKRGKTIDSVVVGKKEFVVCQTPIQNFPTQDELAETFTYAFEEGFLYNRPERIFALTTQGQPGLIQLLYKGDRPKRLKAEFWKKAPNLDAALNYISAKSDGDELIVIDSDVNLEELVPDDKSKSVHNNPYQELDLVKGKIYDGSLRYPELDKFKKMRFGGILCGPYCINYFYNGNQIANSPIANHQPKLKQLRRVNDCLFEITSVHHEGFLEDNDFFILQCYEKIFQQVFRVDLRYIEFIGDQFQNVTS